MNTRAQFQSDASAGIETRTGVEKKFIDNPPARRVGTWEPMTNFSAPPGGSHGATMLARKQENSRSTYIGGGAKKDIPAGTSRNWKEQKNEQGNMHLAISLAAIFVRKPEQGNCKNEQKNELNTEHIY